MLFPSVDAHGERALRVLRVMKDFSSTVLYFCNHFRLRSCIQVLNSHNILTRNLYSNYSYPKPKYLIMGHLDPKPQDLHTPYVPQ